MEPLQNHLNTISAAEFLQGIPDDGTYIAAKGSYSPDPDKSEQYFLFREAGEKIEPLRNAWLTKAEADGAAQKANIRMGFSNAMYLFGPGFIWYHCENLFKVFEQENLRFLMDASGLKLSLESGEWRTFQPGDIKGVRAYLDRGWVECGIKLVTEQEEILVVRDFNEIASADMFYDGLNLLCDTWWAVELGMMLGKALGCPYIPDEDLA